MNKKEFLRNKPFDEIDALQMQQFTEQGLVDMAKTMYTSGVISGLIPTLSSGRIISIGIGKAYDLNYKFIDNTSIKNITVDAGSSSPRYDIISIKFSTSSSPNIDTTNKYGKGTSFVFSNNILDGFTIEITKGTPSTSPTIPSIPSTNIPLAQVYIAALATNLTSSDIVDIRQMSTSLVKAEDSVSHAELNTILGTKNSDVTQTKAIFIETDTRSQTLTYTSGRLARIEEKDGTNIIKTTTFGYDVNSKLTTIVEVAGGKTITTTLTYDGNGILSGTTKGVV